MNRSIIFAVTALLLMPSFVSAQGTDIVTGLPAFTVNLKKTEIYTIDAFKANVARIESAWVGRLNPKLGEADKEKAKMEIMAAAKPKVLDAQISAMLFKQFCEREGVTVTENDVTNYIAKLKSQLGASGETDAALEQALIVSQGLVIDLRTYTRQRLLLMRYIETKKVKELKALPPPTSSEILAAYEKMKPDLVMPETARISIVMVDTRGKGAEEKKQAAEIMKGLYAKVRDDKGYFDKLLLESYDPKAGYVAKSSVAIPNLKSEATGLDQAFIDAVFKLQSGDISGLLENDEGLQIVRVNEKTPSKQLGLSDVVAGMNNRSVQDFIVEQLVGMAQDSYAIKLQSEIMDKLRTEAQVSIKKDNLKGLVGDSELDSIAKRYTQKK